MEHLWLKGGASGLTSAKKSNRLSVEQVTELRLVFDLFDFQKAGSISYRSLKVALRALGFPVKKAEVLQLLERHNEGKASAVQLPAFEAICAEKLHARSPGEEHKLAFQLLSLQSAGIGAGTLQECADALGVDITEDEAAEMVAEFDVDQDGVLNEQEFAAVFSAIQSS